jgi:alpha-L-fucosidase
MSWRIIVVWGFLAAFRLAAEPAAQFAGFKLGLFTHYTYAYPGYKYGWTRLDPRSCMPVPDLQTLADSFDAGAFAETARAMRAEYVIFTLFHARMNILYPSAYWERVLPGHTSSRDVIAELSAELHARNIRLVLYFHPVDGLDFTPEQQERTGWNKYRTGADVKPWNDLINGLMDETGARYGKAIAGYWLDGGPSPPKFDGARFKATIRKHNPEAAVWVNYGLPTERFPNNRRMFEGLSDYAVSENFVGQVAGTTDTDLWPVDHNMVTVTIGREWWAMCDQLLQTPEKMLRYTVRLAGTAQQRHGGVAWAAGPYANNQWETGVREALAELGRRLAPIAESVFGTSPSTSYVTRAGTLQKDTWGVATDSPDGRVVYLHVLNPPASGASLRIPAAADGRRFRPARLLPSGRRVALHGDASGYRLTLPRGETWNAVDTVVKLEVAGTATKGSKPARSRRNE